MTHDEVVTHRTRLFTDADVRALLPMHECIDVMGDALSRVADGSSMLPLRTVIRMPDTPNAFASMPAVHGRGNDASIGAKVITVFPGNEHTAFDSHIGVVLLFDASNGTLLAIADASSITSIRTAAVSGLATRLLANPDASELAIVGAGVLAMPHLEAMCAVRPIRQVRVWSRSGTRAEEFASRVKGSGNNVFRALEIVVSDSAESAVRGAHIVCTITGSREPVLHGAWLAPGTHVNAVGASFPTSRELDTDAVQRARLFVDRRESTLNEAGDFLFPKREGAIGDEHIVAEIGELVLGRNSGRRDRQEITLFKSLGLAVEDVAALRHIHDKAAGLDVAAVSLGGRRH